MDFLSFFAFLSVLAVLCKGEGGPSKPRSGRKYDTQYGPPGNYMDNSDDSSDDSESTPAPPSPPPTRGGSGYGYAKGYPSYRQKGYPFIPYNWEGFTKGSDAAPSMNAVEMMMMMNAVDQIREQEKSGLSKFLSDSKSVLMASVVPLSLILAAVLPVLLNYSMTGQGATGAPSTVTSTAGGRGARGAEGAGALERIVRNFEEMARAVDGDDCLQRALCRVASNTSATLGPDVRRVAATVAGLVADDWADGAGLKGFVSGLKQRSCEEVCEKQSVAANNVTEY